MLCTGESVGCDHCACSGLRACDEGRRRSHFCFGGLEKATFEKNIEDKSRLFSLDKGLVPSPQVGRDAVSESPLRTQNPIRKGVGHGVLLRLQS